jgi:predicted dehydrogenase
MESQDQSRLRLIHCGVGGFGAHWIQNVSSQSPDFALAAIVDIDEARLREAGAATGVPQERLFTSLEAALDVVEADAVVTVTPPAVHARHAELAFARGLHLLTEKPLADTLENARHMVELARAAGRQLCVSQNYRYRPPTQCLKRLLEQKVVGEFGHGHLDFYIPADFTGTFREAMEFPLLIDMAIHHLDLIRYITGRNIVKVSAWSFRPAWSWYRHEPGLKMLLELEGGLPFSYSGDWSARGRATTWNGDWRLQCEAGSLHLEQDKLLVARSERWSRDQQIEEIAAPSLPRSEQAETLHLFAEAIRTGTPAPISGMDNLFSFGAVMAGVLSAQSGQPVGPPVDVTALIG